MKKLATKRLWVKEETHKRAHKRKLDKKLPDIDALINHLLDVDREVNRRK